MCVGWLPALITLEDSCGDWNRYLDSIYGQFCSDFIENPFIFQGKRVSLKRHPLSEGKEATFWHFISEGANEADRIPHIRRCERIAWPRAIMENCDDDCVKMWSQEVNNDQRIHMWCEAAEYLLVVADRGRYVLPWTGYPVVHGNAKKKLEKRWREHKK